jgi:hypothetical protein
MSAKKIQSTKVYSLFERSDDNRPTDAKKHSALLESMKKYGFLVEFPIVVSAPNKSGKRTVEDGQHRLLFAEQLGLPVFWVEKSQDFDIAVINSTAKTWSLPDYARKYAANGLDAYKDGLEFAERNRLPIGTAFALLSGTTTFSNFQEEFRSGNFTVKDRKWADDVAGIYVPMVALAPEIRNARFIGACMAVCRVELFEPKRLLENARRCREKLVPYSTQEAYLNMLESVYNFGRKQQVGLKALASMAMKARADILNYRPGKKSAA